jgi:hypothetical protein
MKIKLRPVTYHQITTVEMLIATVLIFLAGAVVGVGVANM